MKLPLEDEHLRTRAQFMADLAQLKYMEAKYHDRTGVLNMPFDPNWSPGGPGLVYTRYPGIYLDFYVLAVEHHIAVNPSNNGTATTSVKFTSGRIGNTPSGLDVVDLYKYDQTDARKFMQEFIDNTAQ